MDPALIPQLTPKMMPGPSLQAHTLNTPSTVLRLNACPNATAFSSVSSGAAEMLSVHGNPRPPSLILLPSPPGLLVLEAFTLPSFVAMLHALMLS